MHENDETMNTNDETNKGCVGRWGWNTIPVLSLLAIVGWTLYTVATQHFPAFFDGLMWALWDEGSDAYNYPLGVCIAGELAANLVLATLGVYALRLLFKRSASYPALATWVLVGAAFVAGLNCVITRHFGMEVSAKEEQEAQAASEALQTYICLLEVQEDEDGAEMELEVIEQREYVPENE